MRSFGGDAPGISADIESGGCQQTTRRCQRLAAAAGWGSTHGIMAERRWPATLEKGVPS